MLTNFGQGITSLEIESNDLPIYMHICLYHRNITKVVKQDLTGVSIRKVYYVCNEYSWFLPLLLSLKYFLVVTDLVVVK